MDKNYCTTILLTNEELVKLGAQATQKTLERLADPCAAQLEQMLLQQETDFQREGIIRQAERAYHQYEGIKYG